MKKLVCFDVDGTLISYSTNPGHIPEPTREAIRLLQTNGHVVALATGRSLATARRVMEDLGIVHAVLCSGSHVITGGKTLALERICRDRAHAITQCSLALGCDVFANTDEYMYTNTHQDDGLLNYVHEQSGRNDLVKPLDEMDYACIMNIYGKMLPDVKELEGFSSTVDFGYIELRPAGISKAHGIRLLAEHCGISLKHTVAVGDSGNDAEMIQLAGIGIAVGNGSDQAKNVADIVADPIDDGGILSVMKQIGLL